MFAEVRFPVPVLAEERALVPKLAAISLRRSPVRMFGRWELNLTRLIAGRNNRSLRLISDSRK